MSRHSVSLTSTVGLRAIRPAAFTRISTRPRCSSTRWRRASTECRSTTSTGTARLRRPAFSTCAQASRTSPSRRPLGTTSAPASARPSAIAWPRPEVPPMTTATRPVRSSELSIDPFTVLVHIVECQTFHVLDHVRLLHMIEGAAVQPDVQDLGIRKSTDVQRAFCLATGDVSNIDVPDQGEFMSLGALFIMKVDLEHGMGDLADLDVSEIDVFDGAAAHGVGLKAKRLVEIRAV